MRKRLLSIITLLLVSTLLFAAGAKEVASDETVVKVLSVETTDDGYFRLTVQRTDGTVVIYTAGDETVFSVPAQQIHEGSVLAIKDNGIATMSIPAQMFPTEIRDLTLAVSLGAYSFDWAEPGLGAPAVQESRLWDITLKEDLQSRFSYAYAYDLFNSYADQGVTFRGSYLARGILDFYNGTEPLIPVSSMAEDVDLYISTIFNNNVAESAGPAPSSLDEIYAITDFEDLSQRFSYAYGYATAVQDYVSMIQVDPVSFTEGALTAVYGLEPLMDASARETAVNDYVTQLVNDYTAQIEALAAENLQKAEAFLAENKSVEGIVETESGLQYEVVKQGDGAVPAEGDTVIVNYTLRDIDGNMLETADGAQFSLSGLIPGFAEAVRNMQVGGEVIAYVHPDLGYGESGAGTAVEPNALLIFDIELVGIANSETEAAQ